MLYCNKMKMTTKWRDYHFDWNPNDFGGIEGFNIPADKVWKPDLLLFNSADDKFDGTYPVNVVVRNNNIMQWVPPGMFKSTCDIDITWFPFDNQECTLKFGSWTYSGHYIDLKLQCFNDTDMSKEGNCTEIGTINDAEYTLNGEFNINNRSIIRHMYTYNKSPFIYILLVIGIQRKPLYYIFNLIIPCVLISTMALLEFTLPPDAGEKISLGVTILLSMTMFLLLVADKLPQTSGAIPLIGKYFACIMFMCSLSIVFTVLVLNYHHRSVNLKPVPPLIKKIVNTWLAKILFMKQYSSSLPLPSSSSSLNETAIHLQHQNSYLPHDNTASKCHNSSQSQYQQSHNNRYSGYNNTDVEEDFRVSGISDNVKLPKKIPKIPSYVNLNNYEAGMPPLNNQRVWKSTCSSKGDLAAIINELKKITQKIKDDDEESSMAKEWKFAARVIDRCCLIVFSLFTLILTVTILSKAPYTT